MKLVAILRKNGQNFQMENPSIMVLDLNDTKFGFQISNFGIQRLLNEKKMKKNIHSAWYSVIRIDTKKTYKRGTL